MQLRTGNPGAKKDQVFSQVPKVFTELKFGIQSNQDIVNQAVLEVSDKMLYDVEKGRTPIPNGPLDARLGISTRHGECQTCKGDLNGCNGHFGHVKLALPAFHVGYFRFIINILQNICKDCARVLLSETERQGFLRELRRPGIDNMRRTQICKKINDQCRKAKKCPYCNSTNGQIRKVGTGNFKLSHDRFQAYNKSNAIRKIAPAKLIEFQKSFDAAKRHNPEVEKHVKKAMDDLNPLRVLNLFKMISSTDCELLGINPLEGRPEMFIWQFVPVPPVCIRPSVAQDNASTEDDLTTKLAEIVHTSSLIRSALQKGQAVSTIMEQWDYLQQSIAMYINSEVPGLQREAFARPVRGFCQRLKGKQGRFRGNLSGKRVNYSGRTVISPDPNLSIEEVAIPLLVAKNLTYPERAQKQNLAKLQQCVRNGPNVHPGATRVVKKSGLIFNLKFGDRGNRATYLEYGDIVERHLENGDIVLFNRQPSLHKLSIMAHYVKIMPWRTFRLNECVCNPYNADFDGDEMNLHVPQTEEARTEAMSLMGVKRNLSTPKNGEPIIAAIQDFITAAYLLSSKQNFFDRKTFINICISMVDARERIDLPPPAILKPEALWTGKQVFSMLIRPNHDSPVRINHDAKCRDFKPPEVLVDLRGKAKGPTRKVANDLCENDGWLAIRNSEVMCGRMDKTTLGDGKKESIFYVIDKDFGSDEAVKAMNRLAKLSARYLTNWGFSIGIGDVFSSEGVDEEKQRLLSEAYEEADELIVSFNKGTLAKDTGCTMEETMEGRISGGLSKVRTDAGGICIEDLSQKNAALVMAKSGSKGSKINVAQMVALVGQQDIGGQRVPDGFQDRSLPHFPKSSRQPPSKGFVKNSFFSGLTATEFVFHAMTGREGLVDTAVKTAETGYMSRRLMKSLEDLSTQYDNTVRSSSNGIVQFHFGPDKLDPLDMEGDAKPVNLDRTWLHAQSLAFNNKDRTLLPYEIQEQCESLLAAQKEEYTRHGLLNGEVLSYDNQSDYGVDEFDSARDFIRTIEKFICNLASRQAAIREKLNLPRFDTPPDPEDLGDLDDQVIPDVLGEEEAKQAYVDQVAKVSLPALREFIQLCLGKYAKAQVEPGHAVGAVGAQSIGEPGTQMTLKTFHFAGVAGMSQTQGVPRIKEIINASKVIATPIITCPLEVPESLDLAKAVKSRIERIYISDVLDHIDDVWSSERAALRLSFDLELMEAMKAPVDVANIAAAIWRTKKLKLKATDVSVSSSYIDVYINPDGNSGTGNTRGKGKQAAESRLSDLLARLNQLRRVLPNLAISGYPDASRALIKKTEEKVQPGEKKKTKAEEERKEKGGSKEQVKSAEEKPGGILDLAKEKPDEEKKPEKEENPAKHTVFVEGYGLRACMSTPGVIGTKVTSNSIMENRDVLGIEAARTTIAREINEVMKEMNIDPRHMDLLADVMTYKGDVLGITRFGLSKMRDSVLQLASFEKTPDHLFEAAAVMKTDKIEGVSECIIMGQTVNVGTGAFQVVNKLHLKAGQPRKKPAAFENVWKWELNRRKGALQTL